MTQPISKGDEKFIRQTVCVNPRNIDLPTLDLNDPDIPDQKEDCPSHMSVLATFKSLYGNELDMTELSQSSEGRFADRKTEVTWRAFKAALRQQKKAISRSMGQLRRKVEGNLKDDHNYIIGMEVDDATVQFGFRPYRHDTLKDALKQADKLLKNHNRSYSVFKRVARVGEELKDTPVCLTKQKEAGKQTHSPFRIFTSLENYVTNSDVYGDAPTGIVVTLAGKYRVETVQFGTWYDYDTFPEAIVHIANWIKGEKDFEKGKAKNKDSGESRASSPT